MSLCPIKDKTPEISCISCKRTKTSASTKTKFEELMKAYEEEQKVKKEEKEEEMKKQKELRKLQKKENPSSDNSSSNPSKPLTKKQVEKELKKKAKFLASQEESPQKITPQEPVAHKDNDGKLRISGVCPVCDHKVNSFISRDSLSSAVLDYLKVDLTEKPKKRKKESTSSSDDSSSSENKKQKRSKKKEEFSKEEVQPSAVVFNLL